MHSMERHVEKRRTYILFVTEVDSLKRLPGHTFHKVLRDSVNQRDQLSHQLTIFTWELLKGPVLTVDTSVDEGHEMCRKDDSA